MKKQINKSDVNSKILRKNLVKVMEIPLYDSIKYVLCCLYDLNVDRTKTFQLYLVKKQLANSKKFNLYFCALLTQEKFDSMLIKSLETSFLLKGIDHTIGFGDKARKLIIFPINSLMDYQFVESAVYSLLKQEVCSLEFVNYKDCDEMDEVSIVIEDMASFELTYRNEESEDILREKIRECTEYLLTFSVNNVNPDDASKVDISKYTVGTDYE